MSSREEQETRKILRLFKSAMLKVGKIEKVSPISISASQYNRVCREHDIDYVKLEVLRTLGGFIYLRDNIFKELKNLVDETGKSEKTILNEFNKLVKKITAIIKEDGHEATLDDIYNIAYTSTDGNEEIANDIRKIYKDFGMEVYIDVGVTNNEESMVKSYEGLTFDSGYLNPNLINDSSNNSCTSKVLEVS